MPFLNGKVNALFQLYPNTFSTILKRNVSLSNIPRKNNAFSTAIKLDTIGFLQFESKPSIHLQVWSLLYYSGFYSSSG